MGGWKEYKAEMTWHEGDNWVLEGVKVPLNILEYKYVVMNNGHPERWEDGFNRFVDLKLLKDQRGGTTDIWLDDRFQEDPPTIIY